MTAYGYKELQTINSRVQKLALYKLLNKFILN